MEIPEGLDLTFEVRSKNFLEEKSKKQKKNKAAFPLLFPAAREPTGGSPRPLANTETY